MNKIITNNLAVATMIFSIIAIFGGIFGFVNLAGAQCDPSVCGEVPLTCSPQSQTAQINTSVSFTAEGGDGNFSWSAPGANPTSGSAQDFSTSYSSSGFKTVYVYSGTQTKTCTVTVQAPVTHKACVNNACAIVSGPGENTCSNNSDCAVIPPPPPSCDFPGALTGNITSYSGAQAHATVTNHSSCTKTVTFAAYEVFIEPGNPGWLDTQVLYDHQTVTLSAGQTKQLTVDNASCRTQLDVYEGQVQPHLSDAAGGFPGQNLLDYAFTSNPLCGVTPTLSCSPANQTVDINQVANFSATGGTGTYSWSTNIGSDHGNPASGTGANFSTSYSTPGNKTVTVSSGTQTKACNVLVNEPPAQTLSCSPTNQSVLVGSSANFSATGGTGTYSWSSGDGAPTTGNGVNFSTIYNSVGTRTVVVSSGNQTATCSVAVNELPTQTLSCNPQNQSVFVNSAANFTATGGTGTYNWLASGGNPASGSSQNFSTSYSSVGARTVIVTSGNQTATCNVVVNTEPQQSLSCNPQTQSGNVGSYLNFSAIGGTGTYNWIANDGSPSNGNGSNFSTQFNSSGFRTVIVTSGNQTATCNVTINQQPPQNNLTCGPQNQTANVSDTVNFYANGGNGTYSWNAYDAQITYGYNQNFSTRFNSAGSKNVTVTSNGQTATCYVNVNNISGNNTYFQITKNVQNKTLNQNVYVNSIEAQSNDLLEFEIRIRNNGNTSAEVNLKDLLPSDLNYVFGSATNNGYYLNDSVVTFGGVSLGTVYPGEEKVVRLRATVRPNAPAVTITNQAIATMNSNTQNAFATIQLRNRGQVLGAADVVTGPEDIMPWALSLGFLASSIVYFYFFYSRPERRRVAFATINVADKIEPTITESEDDGVFKAVRPRKELDVMLSALKKAETSPDV